MRHTLRTAVAVTFGMTLPALAAGQSASTPIEVPVVGSTLSADVLRDLPLGDNVYAALETTQSEVIADRFNSGGLNAGGDARLGGFLGSWSQTLFRIGDVDVSDPAGGGSSLLFPDTLFWRQVQISTGLMPADVNTPGLSVTLDPRRPGTAWTRVFTGTASGGGLAASAPENAAPPIARLRDWAHGSALVSGPVSDRVGLLVGGTWARASKLQREELAGTRDSLVSGFTHIVFAPSPGREWRTLAWLQHAESPFEAWQSFQQPSATTRDTSIHLQSTWERTPTDGMPWRVFGGFTERARANDVGFASVRVERITAGPVPDTVASAADNTTRRWALGARLARPQAASTRHHLDFGADLTGASTRTTDPFTGVVRELVNGAPARLWTYAPGAAASIRHSTTIAGYASDVITLSPTATLDTSLRVELVRGSADGAATSVSWSSLLPRARLRWEFAERRHLAFIAGYGRTANALNLSWLAFGDPAGSVATVAAAVSPQVVVARVGPGTGGDPAFSRIDADLKRPYTDEFVVGLEHRRSAATRYALTGIIRREANLLGVVDTGTSVSSYAPISLPDAGQDLVGPSDDRTLLVYNRLPASFGRDSYVVTNPDQEAALAGALEFTAEHTSNRLFLLFGATASAAQGSGGNRGYGPLENDQDIPGELWTNPNAATYPRGRLFSDRAFTIKWTTLYRLPGDFTVGAIARYQDGQPFSRLVVVPDLNQGAEAVQAYPNGGTRFTYTGTLDLRVQKGINLGRQRLDLIFDAYNLLTRSNEVEEYVVSGPAFRTSTAIEPPHSIHIGLRLTF